MYKGHTDYSELYGTMNWIVLKLEQLKIYTAEAKDNTLPCKNNKIKKIKLLRPD